MPFNILIGGGPAVLGTLWDVLDGDLDRFVSALLQQWGAGGIL